MTVASLGIATAEASAQVVLTSSSGGISGGTVYLLNFAEEVKVPAIEDLKQVLDWLSPSPAVVTFRRAEQIDRAIQTFRERAKPNSQGMQIESTVPQ
jgi:hypothetical protein